MIVLHATINQWNLTNARVFLRADLNIELFNSTIIPLRLQALLPTIKLLQSKGAKIILATHIGRPQGYQKELSTEQLIPLFERLGLAIDFEPDLATAYSKSFSDSKSILLLDNLRFYQGEKEQDPQFAHTLAQLADYYVNDAFGALARADASLVLLAEKFSPSHRSIGLVIEHELQSLNQLLTTQDHPFFVIFGGNKMADKIDALEQLLPKIDTLFLGPALSFTLLAAQGIQVGTSLVENELFAAVKKLIKSAHEHNVALQLPHDYLCKVTESDTLITCKADSISHNAYGVTIGPETQSNWAAAIRKAHKVLYNGLMGDAHNSQALDAIAPLFNAMKRTNNAVIAGGDSTYAAQMLGYDKPPLFLSTGGSATLAYVSGMPLPGLAPFSTQDKN